MPPTDTAPSLSTREFWIALVLAALALAAFGGALRDDFVDFDDSLYVLGNPQVRAGLTLEGVRWAFTTSHAGYWIPLTWVSHMLDVELFDLAPVGHHLTSLLLHTATTALLFLFLCRATGAVWPSALGAALFGLHPLRVESVVWAAERKDVLALFFGVLTILGYQAYATRPGPARYAAVVVAFGLGLLSKPVLVTLPCALLLLDYWPLKRGGEASAVSIATRRWGRLVAEKAPLLALSALCCLATYRAQQPETLGNVLRETPLSERATFAAVAIRNYLGLTLWPAKLAVIYPHPAIIGVRPSSTEALGAYAVLVAATTLALFAARRRPWWLVGWLWFVGTLVPMLGFVQVGVQWMADRFSYLPSIGLSLAVAGEVVAWGPRSGRARLPLVTAAIVVVACLSLATWRQVIYWRGTQSLFAHALAVTERNWMALHIHAAEELHRGHPEVALEEYRRSAEWNPKYDKSWFAAGQLLAYFGRHEEAVDDLRRAARLNPRGGDIQAQLGLSLLELERLDEAARALDRASALQPSTAWLRKKVALARSRLAAAPRP